MPERRRGLRKTDLYKPPRYVPRRIPSARVSVGPTCRFLDINTNAECAEPLVESGMSRGGIDVLESEFLAGTDRSDDHLVYFVVKGAITATSQDYEKRLLAGDLLISRIDKGLWLQLTLPARCSA